MSQEPRLLLLSAMYENGGNTVHRLLDGHPNLRVYPFESQLGTRYVSDLLSSVFPLKYRWPVFPLGATPGEMYDAVIDEEFKVRVKTPAASKFRELQFDVADAVRREKFEALLGSGGASTGAAVLAFFRATFETWRAAFQPARFLAYVGYSPIIVVDAERIMRDVPSVRILHIVRNPWSAYADTLRRAVPMSLLDYMRGWVIAQQHALAFSTMHPDQVRVLRLEDILADKVGVLSRFCGEVGLEPSETLGSPSWNGTPISTVPPWGVVSALTPEENVARGRSLGADDRARITALAGPLLDSFDYRDLAAQASDQPAKRR